MWLRMLLSFYVYCVSFGELLLDPPFTPLSTHRASAGESDALRCSPLEDERAAGQLDIFLLECGRQRPALPAGTAKRSPRAPPQDLVLWVSGLQPGANPAARMAAGRRMSPLCPLGSLGALVCDSQRVPRP